MQLIVLETMHDAVRAGYACPCGCRPSVEYARGAVVVHEGCCCGNQFAVGPYASAGLAPREGFRPEAQLFDAPWGERLEAAWLVGPSVHGPGGDEHDPEQPEAAASTAPRVDPVCGMAVDPGPARDAGLQTVHQGHEYVFCGRGCKLEFDEDPAQYLDPDYLPSM